MQSHRLKSLGVWITLTVFCTTNAWAASNTLADVPLVSGLGKVVSPNILYILDDSGSMNQDFMPESIANPAGGKSSYLDDNAVKNKLCLRNFGYNTIYYDPTVTYKAPLKGDGTPLNATATKFTAAYKDGYSTGGGTDDLSSTTSTPNYGNLTAGPLALGSNPMAVTNGTRNVTVTYNGTPALATNDFVTLTGLTGTVSGVDFTKLNGVQFKLTGTTATTFSFSYTSSQTAKATANISGKGGSSVKASYLYYGIVDYTVTDNFYYAVSKINATAPPNSCGADTDYNKKTATNYQPTGRSVAEEQLNFANWYSYYRTRIGMMKSASGRAFANMTDKYRMGFTVISDSGMSATKFLGIKKFDATQKSDWYSKLYGISGTSYTPLRAALSKAGRYYAGKVSGAAAGTDTDPVQYSCQRNITILTTDGYWNTNSETGSYGPYQEGSNTAVGDVDGSGVNHPYLDDKKVANTLADVAAYYYKTDLRTGGKGGLTDEMPASHIDVFSNDVKDIATDPAKYQHMNTYTLGLGVDGTLKASDRDALEQGTKQWPDPVISGEGPERIDDLWHAAINGHGTYLSAKNPSEVQKGLEDVLLKVTADTGAASAAATSNLQPVEGGDNIAFIAQYETKTWAGDLLAREVSGLTGAIESTNLWSAKQKLAAQTSDASDKRTIYTFDASGTNKLKSFEYGSLKPERDAGYFDTSKLAQYAKWNSDQKTGGTDQALINYLRGQTGNEQNGKADIADLFRTRKDGKGNKSILGDIASAAPVYVSKPPFAYLDGGYASFIAGNTTRAPVVYVGSNDGMLHAFDGSKTGGSELWAYIPKMVIPNLTQLASEDFTDKHKFIVDGPIVVGDAYNGSTWSTILVGGLGHGGRGYYALDVTDPANPKALWEFDTSTDANIGYSYGNPIITKRASDGKWVVLFASGYNNATGGGDGKGHLFVVDAFTGKSVASTPILTSSINDEQRSGIARVSNYVESGLTDNSTQYVYGGNLDGELWRFDISANTSLLLGRTAAAGARTQPITVQPELAKVRDDAGTWHRVVYFGTGRYLGPNDVLSSDPANDKTQSIYAVKDTGTSPAAGVYLSGALVKQTLDTSAVPRKTKTPYADVDWRTAGGWYVDTPTSSKERFNVDPGLQLGTLVIASNIPDQDYCHSNGSSVLYQLDYKSGVVLKVDTYEDQIVGSTQLQTRGGAGPVVIDPVFGDGSTGNTTQVNGGGAATGVTRVSWREIQ